MKKSIYIMALGAFGIITTEFGIIGIMPAIAKHFQVSIDTAGWLLSGFALTIALTGPFSVLLTSKINRKVMMCLVLLTFVLSNILSAVSPNFTVLMIARILPAFLHPVFWAVATVAASKQVEPKDAPKAVSVVLGGLSVATVLGVPITTYIADLINWQASFIVSGIINLIAFAALLAFVPSMPVIENQSVKSQLVILKKGQMWVNLVATMIMIAGIFATYSFLAEYLGKISSMNGKQISLMLLLFGATGIAGNWVTGLALSKNVLLTTRFFLLSLIAVHMLAYTFGGLFIPMTAIIGIWGFIHTGGFLIGQTRSTAEAPEAPELAASLMVSFGNAGVTLGTFLGGMIITRFGVHEVIWISILLLVLALGLTWVFVGRKVPAADPETPVEITEEDVVEEALGV
ncbi:MFS transporter [Niastella yeongjuensis]|uniref:MFS transporter n=1 Tax=Niastella yeongjuensis TaxID=354355 RepID=A0A1V9F2W0_9BACT|nr:MFS transporter [Niastella yeongjuensis]OQP52602.1 MFS transporter [Niastella yeongjuensis]SEP33835.1 Predicted arabinose efflux permease, MFS family [Niastella yeongjuensis]